MAAAVAVVGGDADVGVVAPGGRTEVPHGGGELRVQLRDAAYAIPTDAVAGCSAGILGPRSGLRPVETTSPWRTALHDDRNVGYLHAGTSHSTAALADVAHAAAPARDCCILAAAIHAR